MQYINIFTSSRLTNLTFTFTHSFTPFYFGGAIWSRNRNYSIHVSDTFEHIHQHIYISVAVLYALKLSPDKVVKFFTTTTTIDPYTLIKFGSWTIAHNFSLLLILLHPLMFECVYLLTVSVSLVNMLSLAGFFTLNSCHLNILCRLFSDSMTRVKRPNFDTSVNSTLFIHLIPSKIRHLAWDV